MATLVNKLNREVKVIIPNMREFRVFYSDNEGSVMFFKRDWIEVKQEGHWKPSEEHLSALLAIFNDPNNIGSQTCQLALTDLYEQLKKL